MNFSLRSAVLLTALSAFSTVAARDLNAIRASGQLRIATEGAYKPFNYFEGKTLTGFEYDLGNALATKLGVKPVWVTQPFDSLLIGLQQGRFDLVIASHTITPEREKAVDFANPHFCTNAVWVVRPGGPTTLAALAKSTVAAQVGTTNLEFLPRVVPGISAANIRSFPKDTDALQALLAGRVNAWSTDESVAQDAVKANSSARLRIAGVLYQQQNGMAVQTGNTSLRAALNTALTATMSDGTYAKLSQKYFGKDIRCK